MRKPFAFIAAILATSPALADMMVMDAYIRAAPPNVRAGAAFAMLHNHGAEDRVLIAADSSAAERVEIHSHSMDGGVMRMREVEGGVAIPAGEAVALAPGGHHIMLIGLTGPLRAGESAALTLIFDDGQEIVLDAPIMKIGAMKKGADQMNHGDDHDGHGMKSHSH